MMGSMCMSGAQCIDSNRKLAFENQPNDASMQSGFLGKAQEMFDGQPSLV